MDLLSRMLVAVDGSAPSDGAVQLALQLATPRHDFVCFVSIFEGDDAAQVETEHALEAAMDAARLAGLDAASFGLTGDPVDAIVSEARDSDASCIVIGSQGRSCAESLLRKSSVPVLVTHASPPAGRDPFERILCATDDSPAAHRAFNAAVALAAERNAELHLLSVVQIANEYASEYEREGIDPDGSMSAIYAEARVRVKGLAAEAMMHGARVKPHVLGGSDVAERIVQCARANRCGIILLGTHGRRGIRRAILGSTAEDVLRWSTIPVLAFRDPREHESAERERRAGALTAS
jgi:nucleotide-binding universal stress UspA family protein